MQLADEFKENPYVTLVARKLRNLKKKHDKIMKIESQLQSGKELDNEQLVLYDSKNFVERSLSDLQSLQVQMEEVAKEVYAATASESAAEATEETKTGNDGRPYHSNSPEPTTNESSNASPSAQFPLTEGSAEVPAVEWVVVVPERVPVEEETSHTVEDKSASGYGEAERYVLKLLKALHVCLRYKGKLPATVDYFGKTLLGQTSINGFQETLLSSAKCCRHYLKEDEAAECEAVRGTTYEQIATMIESLADEMMSGASAPRSAPDTAERTEADQVAEPETTEVNASEAAPVEHNAGDSNVVDDDAKGKKRSRRNKKDRKGGGGANVAIEEGTSTTEDKMITSSNVAAVDPQQNIVPEQNALNSIDSSAVVAPPSATVNSHNTGPSTVDVPLFPSVTNLSVAPGSAVTMSSMSGSKNLDGLIAPSEIGTNAMDLKRTSPQSGGNNLNYAAAQQNPIPFYPPPPPHLGAGTLTGLHGTSVGSVGHDMRDGSLLIDGHHNDHLQNMLTDPLMGTPLFPPHLSLDQSSMFAQLPPHVQQQHQQQMQSFQQFLLHQQHLQHYHNNGHISSATDPLPPSLTNNPPVFRTTNNTTLPPAPGMVPSAYLSNDSLQGATIAQQTVNEMNLPITEQVIDSIAPKTNLLAMVDGPSPDAVDALPTAKSDAATDNINVDKKTARRGGRRGGRGRHGKGKAGDDVEDGEGDSAPIVNDDADKVPAAAEKREVSAPVALVETNSKISTEINEGTSETKTRSKRNAGKGKKDGQQDKHSAPQDDNVVAEVTKGTKGSQVLVVDEKKVSDDGNLKPSGENVAVRKQKESAKEIAKSNRRDRRNQREGEGSSGKKSSVKEVVEPPAPKTFAAILAAKASEEAAAEASASSAIVSSAPESAMKLPSDEPNAKTGVSASESHIEKPKGSKPRTNSDAAGPRKENMPPRKPKGTNGTKQGKASTPKTEPPVALAGGDNDDFELPKRAQKKARKQNM